MIDIDEVLLPRLYRETWIDEEFVEHVLPEGFQESYYNVFLYQYKKLTGEKFYYTNEQLAARLHITTEQLLKEIDYAYAEIERYRESCDNT